MVALQLGALCVATVAVGLAQDPALPLLVDSVVAGIAPVEDDTGIIERTRRIALAYTDNLPNFICTESNRILLDYSGDGSAWRQYSEAVAEARFVDKREFHRTISVDGRPSNEKFKFVSRGAGRFGTLLRRMFRPSSKAVFTRIDDGVVDGREVYVFEVILPKEHGGAGTLSLDRDSSGMPIYRVRFQLLIENLLI